MKKIPKSHDIIYGQSSWNFTCSFETYGVFIVNRAAGWTSRRGDEMTEQRAEGHFYPLKTVTMSYLIKVPIPGWSDQVPNKTCIEKHI